MQPGKLVCLLKVIHTGIKASHAENFILSTTAPDISATVMAANVIWNTAYNPVGIVGAYVEREFDSITPPNNGLANVPMNPQISAPNAKSYPYTNQIILTIAKLINDKNIVFKTFSLLISPP